MVEMPLLALAAEEEYLLAEAEIPEFAPGADAVARLDLAAAAEMEIEAISEREREAEAALGCPA